MMTSYRHVWDLVTVVGRGSFVSFPAAPGAVSLDPYHTYRVGPGESVLELWLVSMRRCWLTAPAGVHWRRHSSPVAYSISVPIMWLGTEGGLAQGRHWARAAPRLLYFDWSVP